MNKQELKKLMLPIIKECIQEVLISEGYLKNIVTEVAKGISSANATVIAETVQEKVTKPVFPKSKTRPFDPEIAQRNNQVIQEINKKFGGMNLFEGTSPAPPPRDTERAAPGPLSNLDPDDPGVDLSVFGLFKK